MREKAFKTLILITIVFTTMFSAILWGRDIPQICRTDFENKLEVCREVAKDIARNISKQCYNTVVWYRLKPSYPTEKYSVVDDYESCLYLEIKVIEQTLRARLKE